MRARGRGRAAPTGGRGRGRGGAHRGRGRPRSLLSLPRAQASWAPQLPAGLTGPAVPCLPSQGEAPAEMGALLLEKEPRGAGERGECGPSRPDPDLRPPHPQRGIPGASGPELFSSPLPPTVHGSLGDTSHSEETLPKANPDSLEPAGPSSPASVTVTVGDEGADTPVGTTPLLGDEPESLEADGGRILLGERPRGRGRGCVKGSFCLPAYSAPPACLFSRPCHKVIPLFPQQGGCLSQSGQNVNDRGRKVAPFSAESGHEAVEHAWGPGSCNCWARSPSGNNCWPGGAAQSAPSPENHVQTWQRTGEHVGIG